MLLTSHYRGWEVGWTDSPNWINKRRDVSTFLFHHSCFFSIFVLHACHFCSLRSKHAYYIRTLMQYGRFYHRSLFKHFKLSSWTPLPGDIEKDVEKETEEVRRAWSIINPTSRALYTHNFSLITRISHGRWDVFFPNIGSWSTPQKPRLSQPTVWCTVKLSNLERQERVGLSKGWGFRKSSLGREMIAGNPRKYMKVLYMKITCNPHCVSIVIVIDSIF